MEKAMNYYQFHIGDYVSHTHHLNDEEDLTYRRMLDYYYQSEQPFNDMDIEKIARRIKSYPEIVQQILEEFFEYTDEDLCWHNKRADAEIAKYHLKAESARKANQKRWGSEQYLKSNTDHVLTNNQEPITNNHKPITKKNITPSRPDDVSSGVWEDWLRHRKFHKASVTDTVLSGIRKEAEKAGMPLQSVFELMCIRNWRGFEAEWIKKAAPTNENNMARRVK
jgi:uncharacterized protein YdaU (DUF1376 family)